MVFSGAEFSPWVSQASAPAMAVTATMTHLRQPLRLLAMVALYWAMDLLMLCVNFCCIV